jgi:hypothetical protein
MEAVAYASGWCARREKALKPSLTLRVGVVASTIAQRVSETRDRLNDAKKPSLSVSSLSVEFGTFQSALNGHNCPILQNS